jgi:hypothetical protein
MFKNTPKMLDTPPDTFVLKLFMKPRTSFKLDVNPPMLLVVSDIK